MKQSFLVPDALRKEHLSPRRSIPGSASPPSEIAAKKLIARIPKAYSEKKHFHPKTGHRDIFDAGRDTEVEPGLRSLRVAACALLAAPSVEAIGAADIDTLAAAEPMLARADSDMGLLGAVAALRGLGDAVRVAVRSTFYKLSAGQGGWTTAVYVVSCDDYEPNHYARWLPLRHAVCGASDGDYQGAVAVAGGLRDRLDVVRRAQIAYVFPDEPWANQDLGASHALAAPARSCGFLLAAATDVAAIREELRRAPYRFTAAALDLAHVLPPADAIALCAEALPRLLQRPKVGPLLKTPPRIVAQVLACFRTPEAAAILSLYAGHPVLAPIVTAYLRDTAEVAPRTATATGQAPPVLRDRPWRSAKRAAKALDVVTDLGLLVDGLERIVLPDVVPRFTTHLPVRDMTPADVDRWRDQVEKGGTYADYIYARSYGKTFDNEYLRVPDAERLRAWNERQVHLVGSPIELVARDGLAAIPGFLRRDWIRWLGQSEDTGDMLYAALCIVSPRMAPFIARVAARRKKFRRVALAWILEHARVAAHGLVPDAVGAKGEARDDASAALLYLSARGEAVPVLEAATRYGIAARQIVERLLARDPLAIAVTSPRPPTFLRLADLPPVALRSGGSLDGDALAALVEMLQITPLDPVYPGIDLVRDACDPAALGAFALALAQEWNLGDAPGRHEWMLFAAVHYPSDAATRRIAQLARDWARRDQVKAGRACVALAALGTDLALLHLGHVAETARFETLRRQAGLLIHEAAEARGLTPEELGDRTVPDVGLDPDGMLRLSTGGRRFVVTLDETLTPLVTEEGGAAPSRSMPRANRTDDETQGKAARERFAALRADLDSVADRQRRRLERAMIQGRSWPLADFQERIVGHPLLVHLARRLVWNARTADGASVLFRVAEDSTLADAGDSSLELPLSSAIRIAHPARDRDLGDGWSRIFSDYAILQPFEQLARAAFTIDDAERGATELTRTAGITAPAKKILGVLESRGFERDDPGFIGAFVRGAGAEWTVRLPLSPGIEIASLASCPDPTTGPATVRDRAGRDAHFGALDAVSFSELVRDAEALRALTTSA